MCLSMDVIKRTLEKISKEIGSEFRLGIAGSYARNEETENSDLDIVIDGDSMRQDIAEYIKHQFQTNVDILWVDLLKKEDEDLDSFCLVNNYPVNDDSVYKTVMREVIWIENK